MKLKKLLQSSAILASSIGSIASPVFANETSTNNDTSISAIYNETIKLTDVETQLKGLSEKEQINKLNEIITFNEEFLESYEFKTLIADLIINAEDVNELNIKIKNILKQKVSENPDFKETYEKLTTEFNEIKTQNELNAIQELLKNNNSKENLEKLNELKESVEKNLDEAKSKLVELTGITATIKHITNGADGEPNIDLTKPETRKIAKDETVIAKQFDGYKLVTDPKKQFDIDPETNTVNITFVYEKVPESSEDTNLDGSTNSSSETNNSSLNESNNDKDSSTDPKSETNNESKTESDVEETLKATIRYVDENDNEIAEATTRTIKRNEKVEAKQIFGYELLTDLDTKYKINEEEKTVEIKFVYKKAVDNELSSTTNASDPTDADGNGLTADQEEAKSAKTAPEQENTTTGTPLPQTNEKASNAQNIAIGIMAVLLSIAGFFGYKKHKEN